MLGWLLTSRICMLPAGGKELQIFASLLLVCWCNDWSILFIPFWKSMHVYNPPARPLKVYTTLRFHLLVGAGRGAAIAHDIALLTCDNICSILCSRQAIPCFVFFPFFPTKFQCLCITHVAYNTLLHVYSSHSSATLTQGNGSRQDAIAQRVRTSTATAGSIIAKSKIDQTS